MAETIPEHFYAVTLKAKPHRQQGAYPHHIIADHQRKGVLAKRGGDAVTVLVTEAQLSDYKADPFIEVLGSKDMGADVEAAKAKLAEPEAKAEAKVEKPVVVDDRPKTKAKAEKY